MVKKRKSGVVKAKAKLISLAQKTEQILLTMPKIIATQIGKDLVIQKQQATKYNLELKKLTLQKKKLAEKIIQLKRTNTAAARKQMASTQKMLQKTQLRITFLDRELELLKKQASVLTQKKSMYSAFQNQVVSFQREWTKKMSQKVKPASKIKTKKTAVIQKISEKQPTSLANLQEDSKILKVIETAAEEESELAQEQREKVS